MTFPFNQGGLGAMFGGLQQQMEALKQQAAQEEVEGQAGDRSVVVVANGSLEIVDVIIAESALADRDQLEDLVIEATNNALKNAQGILASKMSGLLGGLPLPPGLLG